MAVISDKMINLLNLRIKNEEQSSRIYKAMSVWLNLNGYSGASKLWDKYSSEELGHADWVRKYLLDLNILPETPSQEQPELKFRDLPQIISKSYAHELKITNECKELATIAQQDGDWMTFGLAQKYVHEQVDELAKIQNWLDQLEAFGTTPEALRLLDSVMGSFASM